MDFGNNFYIDVIKVVTEGQRYKDYRLKCITHVCPYSMMDVFEQLLVAIGEEKWHRLQMENVEI